jgi:peptide/nickel transport system ATP-binding protein
VLHNGKQVDRGSVERVFQDPTSDYTRELIAAIPGKRWRHAELQTNPNEKVQSS